MISLHKIIRGKILILAAFSLAASSCSLSPDDVGSDWVEESTRVALVDTSTVSISTVMLDSVVTSGTYRIITGIQRDRDFGTTEAHSYMTIRRTDNFRFPPDVTALPPEYFYDSLTLSLRYDGSYYGDTTKLFKLNVHRLREQIELNEYNNLYGYNEFAYYDDPIGTIEFYPRPTSGDSLNIRLSDELGREFLQKLYDREDDMTLAESFYHYFCGIVLIPDPSVETLLGFDPSGNGARMTLHYRTVGSVLTDELEATFGLNTALMFTHLEFDRTGTYLEELSLNNRELRSEDTGNKAFLSSLGGTYMKIEFPYLSGLNSLGKHVEVVAASLYIYPSEYNYVHRQDMVLPDSIHMYISNEKNVTTGIITDNNSQVQIGSFVLNETFRSQTYYIYDVSDFIKEQIKLYGLNKLNLQMVIANYGYALNNLSVDNQHVGEDNIKLKIKLGIYDYQ